MFTPFRRPAPGTAESLRQGAAGQEASEVSNGFTNQQIYELEKRFLYQKYLTPGADRDEGIGPETLGLTKGPGGSTWVPRTRGRQAWKRGPGGTEGRIAARHTLSSARTIPWPKVAAITARTQVFTQAG